MKKFELVETILSEQVDHKSNLRFDSILGIFQDITTMHSTKMGVDHDALISSSNAYWVLSKIKFKLKGLFKTGEEIFVKTWPIKPSAFRFIRNYKIVKDSEFIEGKSEWCVLDANTLSLRKAESIKYPHDMEYLEETVSVLDFSRFIERVNEEDFCFLYKTVFTDIDCNGHVNNLAYARMALNVFSPEEFDKGNFNAFEIHFVSQTYFGEEIKIYKKATDTGLYVEGVKEDKTVFKALFYKE